MERSSERLQPHRQSALPLAARAGRREEPIPLFYHPEPPFPMAAAAQGTDR
jgi:hypothetical protein